MICKEAKYISNCSRNDSNDDIIMLNGSSPVCYKCGNAFKATEGQVKVNITFPGSTSHTTDSYHDVMKNLTNMVLQAMGNKTSVSVSTDDITGIFVKQEKKQDLSPAYFMYSLQSNFNMIEDETQLPTFDRTFSVPKEAFEKASSLNASTLFASLFRFPSFPQDKENSTLLNNEVYSIDMGEVIANLTNTFNLTFRNVNPNDGMPLCSSWDGQGAAPNWTTDGCNTSYVNGTVTCSCQHLTFFAVLMSIPPKSISTSDFNNLTYITSIGCGLSLFFITIALFMHFLLRRGRASISVHILINLFLALFLLNLSFLSNESVANSENVAGCKLMAGVMHYSMLSTFTWFGLQALHLCLQLTQSVATIQHYVTKLSIAGWVPPALVVTVIFISQKYDKQIIVSDTGKNASMCWITDPTVHYVVNIGYYCIIFLFTLLTFVVMLRWLWLLRSKQPTIVISGKKSRPSDALTIMGLCCILGLSWGFAFFAYGSLQIPALYIFTILNSFQGFFLFIYYYKSSKMVGEAETPPETKSLASDTTVVENPYGKHKQF
ncbi:adhesion G-protein coupled receptor G2 [Clarias gariepinus]|uniref:adhesion G-protein coupled receptor G2 n=1 Tax=Clarias gariepinus TaxID=13013 RepID=UPI00234C7371|nr:adhesion G-protein coupled receptor G2 [Clarias gariepinus]